MLSSRTRIGSYEVISPLGAGGMGEVYRARDSRLNRDVALKVLPASFAGDADRLARFAREAQVLAALNHPHIAAIYGLEEHGDLRALVLELVEGETLAARLSRGPLPVAEALEFARQIAAALEAAHEQGIVHRDLKPANISLTKAGVVKVLDFGLAKLAEVPGAKGSLPGSSLSPTITSPALVTNAGMLLGTAAYMSPEQARGREADRRADLWAFGCVLYEMLTGTQAFAGETVTDVIAAVVTKEPDLAKLPADTAGGVRWLLTRCFQKDPRLRFRDAGDAALLLDPSAAPGTTAAGLVRRRQLPWIIGGVAAALVLVAAGIAGAMYWRTPVDPQPLTFDLPVASAPIDHTIAISPDGRRIVYAASAGGSLGLWVRSLSDITPRLIPGTNGQETWSWPFWSPDSRYVAFVVDGKLKRVEPDSGVVETIATIDGQFGGASWAKNGTILVASNEHGLRSVPVAGGSLTDVTKRSPEELYHDCPSFLPDDEHYIYLAYGDKPETRAIYVGEIGSTTRTRLMAADFCPVYVDGYIITTQDQTAFARPFDSDSLSFTGEAIPLATEVATFVGEVPVLTASRTGVIAYRTRPGEAANRRLVWADRNGKESEPVGSPIRTGGIQLSPDGDRVAYAEGVNGGPEDVWVYDLVRGVRTRLTTDPSPDHVPVWSADGRRVSYDSHRHAEGPTIYERVADGSVAERQVMPPEKGVSVSPRSYALDGGHLAFVRSTAGGSPWDLWVLPLAPAAKPFVYAASQFDEMAGGVSPDGKWMAYVTNETGAYQVVVQPFPNPSAGKWQVSMNGGAYPRWRRDSRELYYVAANGDLVAVSVTPGNTFSVGSSTVLFRTRFGFTGQPQGPIPPYDVRADGQRFLMAVSPDDPNATPIRTVVNWPALVKGKIAAK